MWKARALGVLAVLLVGGVAGCSYRRLGPDGGTWTSAPYPTLLLTAVPIIRRSKVACSCRTAGDGRVDTVSLTIDRTVHDFGMVVMQTPSADAMFSVKNSGTATSASLTATLSTTAASLGFSIKGDHCSGMSLAAGASCHVSVVLTPVGAGSPAADLTVSAGPGASVTAHLMATAIMPGALRMTPDGQDFGMVVQNRGSASQTFTITNGGQQITGAAKVVLDGTDKAEFEVTADGCGSQTLAATNGNCQITVRFAPKGLGAKSASLTVSGSPGGIAVAQLSGTGITQGTVTITPDTYDFGSVQQMMTGASQLFTVKNVGQATTRLLATALLGSDSPNFSSTANTCDGHTLAAGDICAVTVQFKPVTSGPKLVSLSVAGAPGRERGGPAVGDVASQSFDHDHADDQVVQSGDRQPDASATFVVANPGGVATAMPTVTVAGVPTADAGQFSIPDGIERLHRRRFAAGQSCMVTVRFTPTTTGIKNGTLTVSASPGTSATVTLTGTGNRARQARASARWPELRTVGARDEGNNGRDLHGDEHRGLTHRNSAGQHRRLDGVSDHARTPARRRRSACRGAARST